MAHELCVEQFRASHDHLLAERDIYYNGDAPKGEIAGWVARRLESNVLEKRTDPSSIPNETTGSRGLLDIWQDIFALYYEFDTAARREEDDYCTRIIRLFETFQYPIPTRVIARVICCSTGHARRFYWDEDENRVREKSWSRSQRERQAPPELVNQVKQRDNEHCVRCGVTSQLIVHHIRPVSQSGDATLENLATLCESCHVEAHGGNIARGLVVYSYDEFWEWIENTSQGSISGHRRQSSIQEFGES